ncbi:Hypothetical predicted protein [Cloeon dipterum]|uniref:Uncharacterized protein n=1 Tax=Cloeon dipterum TaxID=197152 RepID=A0A8S1DN67_9INSE|nr:Hypothetical predicted protein [Cloeon dipterum]
MYGRLVVVAAAVLAAAAASSLHPFVILAPDYGPQRRVDGPEPKKFMVAWPPGVRFPSRQVPLRFVAAMAVPVNTDPLLTQKELSEVVYYTSMDLRKLNGSAGASKRPSDLNQFYIEPEEGEDENDGEEDDYYYDDASTTPPPPAPTIAPQALPTQPPLIFTTQVAVPAVPPTTVKTTTRRPTTARPRAKTPTPTPTVVWTTSASAGTTAVRRAWAPRRDDDSWLEAEGVAYIVVGTCCGLSVLTLAVVLLVLKMRQPPPPPGTESTSDVSSEHSVGASSLQLPQRLINLMNSHSQMASTHKLGSWFNGRPTALSLHGQGMAFPTPKVNHSSLNGEVADFDQIQVHIESRHRECDQQDSSSSAGSSLVLDADEADSLQRRSLDVANMLDDIDESASGSSSSRHDTFIFWSSNSDRLV